jgi:hypothetical protein
VRPILVLNPVSDLEFVELARSCVETGADSPASLQERLRERYPAAIVRPRELADERDRIWYIYREGHWVRS